jgi:hypothetical protein
MRGAVNGYLPNGGMYAPPRNRRPQRTGVCASQRFDFIGSNFESAASADSATPACVEPTGQHSAEFVSRRFWAFDGSEGQYS